MSVRLKLTIQCDGCREKYEPIAVYADPRDCNLGAVRREAFEAGWRRKGTTPYGEARDYCPRCIAAMAATKDVSEYVGGPVKRRGVAGAEVPAVLAVVALAGVWQPLATVVVVALVVAVAMRAPDHVPWRRGVEPTPGPLRFVIDDGSSSPYEPRPNLAAEAVGRVARRLHLDRIGIAETLLALACLSCAAGIAMWLYRDGWITRWTGC